MHNSMRNPRMGNTVKLRSCYCSEMIKDICGNPRALFSMINKLLKPNIPFPLLKKNK